MAPRFAVPLPLALRVLALRTRSVAIPVPGVLVLSLAVGLALPVLAMLLVMLPALPTLPAMRDVPVRIALARVMHHVSVGVAVAVAASALLAVAEGLAARPPFATLLGIVLRGIEAFAIGAPVAVCLRRGRGLARDHAVAEVVFGHRSEEHTSELQSQF